MTTPDPLSGTWFIGFSSLALWRRRAAPALGYLPLPDGAVCDVVSWRDRRGRRRTLLGFDRPVPRRRQDHREAWEWRGAGVLTRRLRSRWSFVALDPAGAWAVSLFERTPFTAAGVDVCFRSPEPDAADVETALAAVEADPGTAAFRSALFRTRP